LSDLSGVPKGTISKIEIGDVKRPDFQTVLSLGEALNTPIETIVEYYVEVEARSDHLMRIYGTALTQGGSIELIRKVATKYLDSQNEDSLELTEKLFQSINSIQDTSIKISLYDLIIDYSRSHGIMPYIAKGMYQKYLIERNDFSKLKETYYNGKYLLHYSYFLLQEDQIELYYKLGVHAHSLRLYHESVNYCKRILAEDDGSSPYRIHALAILSDSYYGLEKYEESELYSLQFKQFNYPNTHEHSVLMEAVFNAAKGKTDKAIKELEKFLETCGNTSVFSASRHLLRLYLKQKNFDGAKSVIESDRLNSTIIDKENPLTYYWYGEYLRLIGEYYLAIGDIDNSINHLLEGAMYFSKINDSIKEKECLDKIVCMHIENNISMGENILKKLNQFHNVSI
jgi:tetratricopeptide (TPR) repeat protein